jgi:hypothetical protein
LGKVAVDEWKLFIWAGELFADHPKTGGSADLQNHWFGNMKQGGIPFGFFAALWLAALALPLILFRFSPLAAAVTGVALPILWVIGMPCTCMKGGFAAFPMAVVQIASLYVGGGVGIHFLKA